MATSDAAVTNPNITADAQFRAFAQAIHDALAAVGMVQTADTGQINLSTATTPGSNFTFNGYEVWRFDDAAQGADPIYFRIDYGRAGAADRFYTQINVGTGSNGSGTITNPSGTQAIGNGTSAGTGGRVTACFSNGSLSLQINASTNSASSFSTWGHLIERGRDPQTQALVTGTIIAASGGGANNAEILNTFSARVGGAWATGVVSIGPCPKSNNKVALGGYRTSAYSLAPVRGFLLAKAADIAIGDSGVVSIASSNHTYLRVTASPGMGSSGLQAVLQLFQ